MVGRRRRSAATLLLLSVMSLGLVSASAYALVAELNQYAFAGTSPVQRMYLLAEGKLTPGLSRSSRGLFLDECVQAMSSVQGLALPTNVRLPLIASCAATTADLVVQSPVDSYAVFVQALVAAEGDDSVALSRALILAHQLAPNEQWLAELRSMLAENHLSQIGPAAEAAHDRDLKLLVTSTRGIKTIARRYTTVASFRDRILAIVEQLPADLQRRFVAALNTEIVSGATNSTAD